MIVYDSIRCYTMFLRCFYVVLRLYTLTYGDIWCTIWKKYFPHPKFQQKKKKCALQNKKKKQDAQNIIYIIGEKKNLTGGRWWKMAIFGRMPLDFGLPDRLKIFWGGYGKLRSWSCEIRWVCSIRSGLLYVSVRKSYRDFPEIWPLGDLTFSGLFVFLFQSSPYIGPKPHITSHNITQHHITPYNTI